MMSLLLGGLQQEVNVKLTQKIEKLYGGSNRPHFDKCGIEAWEIAQIKLLKEHFAFQNLIVSK